MDTDMRRAMDTGMDMDMAMVDTVMDIILNAKEQVSSAGSPEEKDKRF